MEWLTRPYRVLSRLFRASRNGDRFTDVRSNFTGHEICDSSSWLHSVTWPIDESYHPTANGQELGYLPAFSAAAS